MKIISKLLIASAVAVSFAAPAFAIDYNSDSFILQERGAWAAPQAQTRDWTAAYAMESRVSGAYAQDSSVTVDGSSTAGRGADALNGGN